MAERSLPQIFRQFWPSSSKATPPASARPPNANGSMSLFGIIRESFSGAWSRSITVEPIQNLLAFSAVYACISLISNDISKLRIKLIEQNDDKVSVEVDRNSPFWPVLRKPNLYQTRIQFLSQWIISKLIWGNTYVYKQRDQRTVVTGLMVLDPRLVQPLVANDGSVWYRCGVDDLAQISSENTFPASEIIHDRGPCLFHPLIGVPPIYACAASTTQGIRIQANSEQFFKNMSMPSGQLTTNNTIDDVTAERLKKEFEKGTTGPNMGRIFVGGDGLKFEPFGMVPPDQAKLVEQLGWTLDDIARAFSMPVYKIGGEQPKFTNAAQADLDYYKQCLQNPIEDLELLLEEGLGLTTNGMAVELDLEGLLRMDPEARAQTNAIRMKAGYLSPNEARLSDNLGPVDGGETPYIQQQNWPLAQLNKRPPPALNPSQLPAPAVPALPAPAKPKPTKDGLPAEDKPFHKFFNEAELFAGLLKEFSSEVREGLRTIRW